MIAATPGRYDQGLYPQPADQPRRPGRDEPLLPAIAKAQYYYPIADGWILNARIQAGDVIGLGERVNIESRFFIGGDDLRGFRIAGIGPRDFQTHDPLGGDYYYTALRNQYFRWACPGIWDQGVRLHRFRRLGRNSRRR